MYDSSGGDDNSRRREASEILEMLDHCDDSFNHNERDFVMGLVEIFRKYGDRTRISPKQLFWLRDIKDKYL